MRISHSLRFEYVNGVKFRKPIWEMAAGTPSATIQPLAASIILVSVMLSRRSNKGCGTIFMSPLGLLLQKGSSCARIIAGSARQIGVVLVPTVSCPCQSLN